MSSPSESDSLRIGTVERDEAARILGEHFADGRLSEEEYDSRLSASLSAVTRGDVRAVFDDLPEPLPGFMRSRPSAPASVPGHGSEVATVSDKSRIAAGVLQIVLPFGIGRFYTGHTRIALAQLILTFLTFGLTAIWSVVDGILLLVNGGYDTDGRRLRD